jgi:hypothetical protein
MMFGDASKEESILEMLHKNPSLLSESPPRSIGSSTLPSCLPQLGQSAHCVPSGGFRSLLLQPPIVVAPSTSLFRVVDTS